MDKYKKIADLGIEIHIGLHPMKVMADADDLLKVLNSGVEVYCTKRKENFTSYLTPYDTNKGLVIGIKELKPKQVTITRADLNKAWKKAREGSCIDLNEIAKELGL